MTFIKKKPSLVMMGSGEGSTIRSLCEAAKTGDLSVQIKALVTDQAQSGIPLIGKEYSIPVFILPFMKDKKEEWDQKLLSVLQKNSPDLIVLAGFLRKIGPKVLSGFQNRIINSHPALLPEFGGEGMYGLKVHQAVLEAKKKQTGLTVHLVDADYDTGKHLVQETIDVLPEEDPLSLQARVKRREKQLYKETIKKILSGEVLLPRSFKEFINLFLKGTVIGLSVVLPGVSGGTVAFLLGIYEKLIFEISKMHPKHLLPKFFPQTKTYDWGFLISFFLGAVCSIGVFAFTALPFIKAWPEVFKFLVFILVLIFLYPSLRDMKKTASLLGLSFGTALVSGILFYALKDISFVSGFDLAWLFFPAGVLAGLALVLPGISGSYLLLLFGLYEDVLLAVKDFQVLLLGLLFAGVITAVLLMARLMRSLLKTHFYKTEAVIIGLILGSLFEILPL